MTADYDAAVRDHVVDMLHLDGELAALIEMQPEADYLLVVNVAVSPAYQSRGYGRALLVLPVIDFALDLRIDVLAKAGSIRDKEGERRQQIHCQAER